MIQDFTKVFNGKSKIQTGNLLENLNEAPTSLLVEAEEENKY